MFCAKKQKRRNKMCHRTKHGLSRTKVYRAWIDAKNRCFNPDSKEYKRYGLKGITMDKELVESVVLWYKTLGDPPEGGSRVWSVDRIDCAGNYSVGNIKWASAAEQTRNQKKISNNSTGVTGVSFGTDRSGTLYVNAWWSTTVNAVKKNHAKGFSVKKHGLLPAFKLACEYRLKMIKELNDQGAGYSSNHGQ